MLGPQANYSCHANQGYVAGGRGVVCMLRIPLRANWCAVAHTLLSMCSSTGARLAALQILFFISRDSDGVKIGWPLSRECDGCGPLVVMFTGHANKCSARVIDGSSLIVQAQLGRDSCHFIVALFIMDAQLAVVLRKYGTEENRNEAFCLRVIALLE